VASNFFNYQLLKKSGKLETLELTLVSVEKSSRNQDLYYTYVPTTGKGFIIVAADDASMPILGYSLESKFNGEKSNTAFKGWMSKYADAIEYIKLNNIEASSSIQNYWSNCIKGNFSSTRNILGVEPLCKAIFNQDPFVNDQTPFDKDEDKNCVTGCPATAMAIIMKKWNHPAQGTGFHTYNHPKYGALSANFGNTTYDWDAIPNDVTEANAEIAKVMFHCGVATNMQYTANSSGAYILIDSPTPMANCEYAYKTYFGYSRSLEGLYRDDFTDEIWIDMLKKELDESRPMQYAGFGGGGHTFVCDGYDDNMNFHMNWGWGGAENGYFMLNSLNPGAGGIGSGEGTYNNDQQAIIGIKPLQGFTSSAPKFGLNLGSGIMVDKPTIIVDSSFTVNVDIKNIGTADYTSDVAAILFNSEGTFIDYVAYEDSVTFKKGETFTFTFSSDGISTIPEVYSLGIYSSEANDSTWHLIKGASFKNPIDIKFTGEPNDINLNTNITLPATPIFEQIDFNVNTTLVNRSTEKFVGTIAFDIFNSDVDFIKTIYEKKMVTIEANGSLSITIPVQNQEFEPGSYYIAGFTSKDDSIFTLISNDSFPNPILFDIQETPLFEDDYEMNNNTSQAYKFPLVFQNDRAEIITTGSNFHDANDIDHYRIDLDSGYTYIVKAKLLDEHSVSNNGRFSVDAYFTFDQGQGQSAHINSDIEKEILTKDRSTLRFKVSPFFVGFTGKYQLEIGVERKSTISSVDFANLESVNVYPNPTNGFLTLVSELDINKIENISIIDILGRKMNVRPISIQNDITFDMSEQQIGIYFIKIQVDNQFIFKQFILQK